MKKNKEIDNYISKFPQDIQTKLTKLRSLIAKAAPKAEEVMGYGVPAFKQGEILVYFAAFKKHVGFYPTPKVIQKFKKELQSYQVATGTVKFPFDREIPFKLIEKMVKYRLTLIN